MRAARFFHPLGAQPSRSAAPVLISETRSPVISHQPLVVYLHEEAVRLRWYYIGWGFGMCGVDLILVGDKLGGGTDSRVVRVDGMTGPTTLSHLPKYDSTPYPLRGSVEDGTPPWATRRSSATITIRRKSTVLQSAAGRSGCLGLDLLRKDKSDALIVIAVNQETPGWEL